MKRDILMPSNTFKYIEATYRKEPTRFAASLWLAKHILSSHSFAKRRQAGLPPNQRDLPRKLKSDMRQSLLTFISSKMSESYRSPHEASILEERNPSAFVTVHSCPAAPEAGNYIKSVQPI